MKEGEIMEHIKEYELKANVCGKQVTVPVTFESKKDKSAVAADIFKAYASKIK